MDNTHQAKSHFNIFTLEEPGTSLLDEASLISLNLEFPNHEEARIWIEDHGDRKKSYVVLEVCRKE